ncbi:uncharacterized protein EV420DRAFT_920715 [Desarmillaria tabescens]|uniref:Uncharacterized protein n=1 Tax=Armillaria tabescens TaxID=1929756 RepID=A0AA39JMZ4_ARMTA|nr:uncharacterized protein EV420DRAFT_920715 [Desarmillaria tabescens]KAK0445613.1 hypothetical protein EV420DRAFT_920715 [Desarmillaria tabescens]
MSLLKLIFIVTKKPVAIFDSFVTELIKDGLIPSVAITIIEPSKMSEPTNVDNKVVIAERGDQRIAIPKTAFVKRSYSSFQAYANQQLDTVGTLVTRSLIGYEGQDMHVPKRDWTEVQPLIHSVQIQSPPPPNTGTWDAVLKAMTYVVMIMAAMIFGKFIGFF